MFAYCGNNPSNCIDETGMWTLAISVRADFTFFFLGMSISIGISFDGNGNVVIQSSYSAPNYVNNDETYNVGLMDAGAGFSFQVTDDDTVFDLEGPSSYAGAAGGNGGYIAVDMVYSGVKMMDDASSEALPNGIQVTVGGGVGIDAHFRSTQTKTILIIRSAE